MEWSICVQACSVEGLEVMLPYAEFGTVNFPEVLNMQHLASALGRKTTQTVKMVKRLCPLTCTNKAILSNGCFNDK